MHLRAVNEARRGEEGHERKSKARYVRIFAVVGEGIGQEGGNVRLEPVNTTIRKSYIGSFDNDLHSLTWNEREKGGWSMLPD